MDDADAGKPLPSAVEHLEKRTIVELVEIPGHPPRTASAEFRRNAILLVRKLDLGCWICGSKEKREVHHIFEWSLWPGLDLDVVLTTLHTFDPYGYTVHQGEEPIHTPDDLRNLLVLCGSCLVDGETVAGGHHRGLEAGIHALTWPIWLAQKAARAGVSLTEAIDKAKAEDPALAAAPHAGHAHT